MGMRAHDLEDKPDAPIRRVPPDVEYPPTLAGVRQAIEDLRDTGNRYCSYQVDSAVLSDMVTRLRNIDEELVGFATKLRDGQPVDQKRLVTTLREVDELITRLEHNMSLGSGGAA